MFCHGRPAANHSLASLAPRPPIGCGGEPWKRFQTCLFVSSELSGLATSRSKLPCSAVQCSAVHYIPPESGACRAGRGALVNIVLVLSVYNASVTRLPRAIFSNIVLGASPLGLYWKILLSSSRVTLIQCSAVQCSAVQCSAVQCSAVQCSAVQCSALQFIAVQCSAVQCSPVQCSAEWGNSKANWPPLPSRPDFLCLRRC